MNRISLMSADLANRIAAGEVIDRPSSVVKELVENAIDARSNLIRISIKGAGREEIRVQDDGSGMDRIDAELCFLRHASSKIKSTFDLRRITTLGFRGEALPSIAAISHVELLTYDGSANPGTRVLVSPGAEPVTEDGPQRQGSVFTVKDLFFNTPARLKYLRSDMTETANITEAVEHIAIGFPQIAFVLEIEGKTIFHTSGRGDIKAAIMEIYGLETAHNMVEIEGQNSYFKLSGYIARPTISFSNRYHQLTFLNSRPVYIFKSNQAASAAYRDYLPPNRYPFTILFIEVDHSLVDINVHPAKREVRISEEDKLAQLIELTIRKALLNLRTEYMEAHQPLRAAEISAGSSPAILKDESFQLSLEDSQSIERFEQSTADHLSGEVAIEASLLDGEPKTVLPTLVPLGQIIRTYIVCDSEDGLYLIDQHAAAERINYEKAIVAFESEKIKTSIPLVPLVLELPPNLFVRLDDAHLTLLHQAGFTISIFGAGQIRIEELPTVLQEDADTSDLLEMISSCLKDESAKLSDLKHLAIASIACKASIKANMTLSVAEMEALIRELNHCQNPANCPHGRPTIVKISRYEIEKMFRRTGF